MTRNDERQGQRMMRKTYLMCDKEKDNEGDMQQLTINNQQSTINTRTTTMTRDDNKDEGKGQVMTSRTTRDERKACT